MKVIEIHYERVNNLGNYETERVKAIATVDMQDNPAVAYKALKKWVEIQLGKRRKPSKAKVKSAKEIVQEAEDWNDEDVTLFGDDLNY